MEESISVEKIDGRTGIVVKTNKTPDVNVQRKIKVLWYSDFLRHTGFGNVAEAIMSRLQATGKYEFEVLGINYSGDPYNTKDSEYYHLKDIPVWPAYNGREESLFGYNRLSKLLATRQYDIFFVLQDAFNMIPMKDVIDKARKHKDFRYIFYFPIDGDIQEKWVRDGIQIADYPVVYSEYGKKQVHKVNPSINLSIIPHGADLVQFSPFEDENEKAEFRRGYFGASPNEFVITNVNRNQPRKDLPRMLLAFSHFCKEYPDIKAKLYLHCHAHDSAGHKIHTICKKYLPKEFVERVILPDPAAFGENGYPIEMLRRIYGASDVVTSTTFGEGWGLSTTEAMACKVPVVMPRNSATTEIIGENEERGYLVDSGTNLNLQVFLKHDNELMRPVTDVYDLVKKWKHVYENKEEALQKVNTAYTWLQNKNWDKIVKEYWEPLFDKAYNSLQKQHG